MTTHSLLGELSRALNAAALEVDGDRSTSLGCFSSAGRATARPDADLDVLPIVDPLPDGGVARLE